MTATRTRPRPRATLGEDGLPGGWGDPGAVTLAPVWGPPVDRPTLPDGPSRRPRLPEPGRPAGALPEVGPRALPTLPDLRTRPAPPVPGIRSRPARPVRHVLLVLWLGSLLVVLVAGAPASPPRAAGSPASSPVREPGRPGTTTPSPTTAIARLVDSVSTGHVSVAALDLATGRSFGYGAGVPVHTASVVKLDVLETLLLQAQDAGSRLTPQTSALATRMMENSDNDAATRLWNLVGGAGSVARANVRLGARCTWLDGEHWGTSTTCAADQVALLAALAGPGPLRPAARAYAADLLTHVEDDQRWGISAVADPDAATGLKNGWLPLDDDGGRWVVNSVGTSTVDHHPVLLAVLTERQPSEEAGIDLVEALARQAARAVVTGTDPSPGGGPSPGP